MLVRFLKSHTSNEHGSHKNHTLEAKVKHHHHQMLTLIYRQRRCDESVHLSHIKHGHNNIEKNEHCGGTTCNDVFHNVHKWLVLERDWKMLHIMKARGIFKAQNVMTNCCNIKGSPTNHHRSSIQSSTLATIYTNKTIDETFIVYSNVDSKLLYIIDQIEVNAISTIHACLNKIKSMFICCRSMFFCCWIHHGQNYFPITYFYCRIVFLWWFHSSSTSSIHNNALNKSPKRVVQV